MTCRCFRGDSVRPNQISCFTWPRSRSFFVFLRKPAGNSANNVLGTAHVLESIRIAELPCPVVVITSDKCYENKEWDFAYRENDPLGGHDIIR